MLFEDQNQREALINLMLVARFSDKKLSLAEEETFETILAKVYWQDVMSSESYINEAIGRVRDIFLAEETLDAYIKNQCVWFKNKADQDIVLQKINSVCHADGLVEIEQQMMQTIQDIFNGINRL